MSFVSRVFLSFSHSSVASALATYKCVCICMLGFCMHVCVFLFAFDVVFFSLHFVRISIVWGASIAQIALSNWNGNKIENLRFYVCLSDFSHSVFEIGVLLFLARDFIVMCQLKLEANLQRIKNKKRIVSCSQQQQHQRQRVVV